MRTLGAHKAFSAFSFSPPTTEVRQEHQPIYRLSGQMKMYCDDLLFLKVEIADQDIEDADCFFEVFPT
jgi:hypothetical protein